MRHEKTVSVSKLKPLWEPWEEDETPRKAFSCYIGAEVVMIEFFFQVAFYFECSNLAKIYTILIK